IHRFANEQLSFKTLQALLTGSSDPVFISDETSVSVQSGSPVLSGLINGLAYSLVLNGDNNIVKTSLNDESAGPHLTASYADFYSLGGQAMPYTVNIQSAAGSDQVIFNLSYSQAAVNETLYFPFSVSKRFTIKD